MQILFNSNIFSTTPTFQSKKPMCAKEVMKSFEERIASPRSQLKNVDALKLILQNLLKGFKAECLAENFGFSLSKVYEFSNKYNTHKIYIQDRDNIILKRLLNGEKREKIAKEMDLNLRTIQTVADRFKTTEAKRVKRDELIVQKFKSGMKINDIADTLGIDSVTVRRALKKAGVK